MNEQSLPTELGYKMPPEWFPHDSTWLVWPNNSTTWPDRIIQVQKIYLQLISLLASHEKINILVDNKSTQESIYQQLKEHQVPLQQIHFHLIPTADSWIRDYGPNFIVRLSQGKKRLAFNHWKFNAWGNKYEKLKLDTNIPKTLEPVLKVPRFTPPLVLEGGSFDINGEGICLTTESCLLNPNRNPNYSRLEIEQCLADFTGINKVIWLGEGIVGSDTDGHVDELARFANSNTIMCAIEEDPSDENYSLLKDNYQRLEKARDLKGRPFKIVSLPMPKAVQISQKRLPASYANFYIANKMVLVPTFNQAQDQRAIKILQKNFHDRKVIGVHCSDMLLGMGTLHCITQQQPESSFKDIG